MSGAEDHQVSTMTPAECEFFVGHLRPETFYLEFGSGRSTSIALSGGVRCCVSVESDPRWLERLRLLPEIVEAEKGGRLAFKSVDIGPVGEWSVPIGQEHMFRWPNYFLSVWSDIKEMPDVILVDGRFRVACALCVLLVCPPTSKLLMHDFFDKNPMRKRYATLLDVAVIVDGVDNLVLLQRKPDVWRPELLARLGRAWLDFG